MGPHGRETVKDLLLVLVLAGVGVGGFLFVNPSGAEVSEGPGGLSWRSMPFIYSGLLLFLVALLGVATLAGMRRPAPDMTAPAGPEAAPDPAADGGRRIMVRRVLTVGCILLYAAGIEAVGFAISTPLLLFAMLTVLGRRDYRQSAVLALAGGLLLWVLFVGILKLPMTGLVWDPVTPVLDDLYRMTGAR